MDEIIYVCINLKKSFGDMFFRICFNGTAFEHGRGFIITPDRTKPSGAKTRIKAQYDHGASTGHLPKNKSLFFSGSFKEYLFYHLADGMTERYMCLLNPWRIVRGHNESIRCPGGKTLALQAGQRDCS